MDALFIRTLNMSITASYVILAVFLVRLALRTAPKGYSYALWSVVLFRLICPVSFSSVLSMFNAKPFDMTAAQQGGGIALEYVPADVGYMGTPKVTVGIPAANEIISNSLPAANPMTSVNPLQVWIRIGAMVWFAGIAGLLIYGVVTYIRLRRCVATAVRLSGDVYESDRIPSPFILGFAKPRIYIPFGLGQREREYILTHERYHLKRKDHLAKLLGFGALTVHWFNPLVWLAFHAMTRDMEMSCDEKVLAQTGTGIAKEYSTSLLSFAGGHRFFGASPLTFAETGIAARVKNVLRFRPAPKWATFLAAALCIPIIAACASNPAIDPVRIKPDNLYGPDDLYGSFRFQKLVYMCPLSSFLPQDGYRISFTLTPDSLIITDENGGQRSEPITYESSVVDEDTFRDDFMPFEPAVGASFNIPDITGYTERYRYDLSRAAVNKRGWRLYLMDDEIWIASTTEQHIWSIYRVARYDDVQPEAMGYLESIFEGGTRIWYQETYESGIVSDPRSVRAFQLTNMGDDKGHFARYRILFQRCEYWARAEETVLPSGPAIYLGDVNGPRLIFVIGTGYITYVDGNSATTYITDESFEGALPDDILMEFSQYEYSYENVQVRDEGYGSFEEVAYGFMSQLGQYWENMTPENINRITGFKVLEIEVKLTREGDDSIFGFSCTYAIKPVNYNIVTWWAGGGGDMGTGNLEGWIIMERELRLEREDGFWRCTSMGTGGMRLD